MFTPHFEDYELGLMVRVHFNVPRSYRDIIDELDLRAGASRLPRPTAAQLPVTLDRLVNEHMLTPIPAGDETLWCLAYSGAPRPNAA